MRTLASTSLALLVGTLAGCYDLGKIPPPRGPAVTRPPDAAVEVMPEAAPEVTEVAPEAAPDQGDSCMSGQSRVGELCLEDPPSCAGLAPTCGPERNEDCCKRDPVVGGRFDLGYDKSDTESFEGDAVVGVQKKGAVPVIIDGFALDRYEVTVGRFRKFVASYDGWLQNNPNPRAGNHPKIVASGWNPAWQRDPQRYSQSATELRTNIEMHCNPSGKETLALLDDATGASDTKPMPCVSWHEAMLFCIWDRGRLPTEAEWNYAAAGGEQQNPFPWGLAATTADVKARANIDRGGDSVMLANPVGMNKLGAGRYGQHDLAGNLWEWVADQCSGTCTTYTTANMSNPFEFMAGNPVVRGGSFKYGAAKARTAFRLYGGTRVVFRYIDLGFRCARNL